MRSFSTQILDLFYSRIDDATLHIVQVLFQLKSDRTARSYSDVALDNLADHLPLRSARATKRMRVDKIGGAEWVTGTLHGGHYSLQHRHSVQCLLG